MVFAVLMLMSCMASVGATGVSEDSVARAMPVNVKFQAKQRATGEKVPGILMYQDIELTLTEVIDLQRDNLAGITNYSARKAGSGFNANDVSVDSCKISINSDRTAITVTAKGTMTYSQTFLGQTGTYTDDWTVSKTFYLADYEDYEWWY